MPDHLLRDLTFAGIEILFSAVSLGVAVVMWKLFPRSNLAYLKGHHWKAGGAFAGYVLTFLALHAAWYQAGERYPVKDVTLETPAIMATVVDPPTDMESYTKLFDDFSQSDFYAFNPPFAVEKRGTVSRSRQLDVHEVRYKSNVVGHYLFFDENSYKSGQDFWDELAERFPEGGLKDLIMRCHWPDVSAKPGYTFFLGNKNGKKTIVFYPKIAMQNGVPESVIYIEGETRIYDLLVREFMIYWEKGPCQPIGDSE